jgi:hypothetical protein
MAVNRDAAMEELMDEVLLMLAVLCRMSVCSD